MPGPAFMETERTALRTAEEEDLDWIQSVFNDSRVWGRGTFPRPPNSNQMQEFYEDRLSDEETVTLLVCIDREYEDPGTVADRTDPVGLVGLNDHQKEQRVAELSYWLDPDAWGNGYATEAAGRLVAYGFEQRALRKWKARVVGTNERSMRVLERLGFEEEGVHRGEWFLDGDYRDVHWFGLLREEWDGSADQ